jgi:hypothetical protein
MAITKFVGRGRDDYFRGSWFCARGALLVSRDIKLFWRLGLHNRQLQLQCRDRELWVCVVAYSCLGSLLENGVGLEVAGGERSSRQGLSLLASATRNIEFFNRLL